MSMPPMKPTVPVLEALAAESPTRKEPSFSLKTIGGDVRQVDDGIDDREVRLGVVFGHGLQSVPVGEAENHDRVVSVAGETR